MLQVSNIAENKDAYIQALKKRKFDAKEVFDKVLSLDEKENRRRQNWMKPSHLPINFPKRLGCFLKMGNIRKLIC